MAQKYQVNTQGKLLAFLFENLEGWSKKTVKQRLKSGGIFVNGEAQTQHDYFLNTSDIVSIGLLEVKRRHQNDSIQRLEILHQDKDLIAINKPAGLLSVGSTKENKNHALALLRTQLIRNKDKRVQLWPVHRLDRETSGILLFATSKEMREKVMARWGETQKDYLAIVNGIPKVAKDTITQPLRLDKTEYRMHVGKHKEAKPAITHYEILKSSKTRSFLSVVIETGRQHQIRAHLSWLGHSIIGDERYGKKGGRMGLHATKLSFIHPTTEKNIVLEVEAPLDFRNLL